MLSLILTLLFTFLMYESRSIIKQRRIPCSWSTKIRDWFRFQAADLSVQTRSHLESRMKRKEGVATVTPLSKVAFEVLLLSHRDSERFIRPTSVDDYHGTIQRTFRSYKRTSRERPLSQTLFKSGTGNAENMCVAAQIGFSHAKRTH